MLRPAVSGARDPVPRSGDADYTSEMAARRREFVRARTGAELSQVAHSSVGPSLVSGNVENFIGVAQVPIGLAGPIRVMGEHAEGDFYVPLATTEGTRGGSYNRGMRLLTECGGVRATVVEQSMQRAPVFVLPDARSARAFGRWVEEHLASIKEAAEATTRVGRTSRWSPGSGSATTSVALRTRNGAANSAATASTPARRASVDTQPVTTRASPSTPTRSPPSVTRGSVASASCKCART